MTTKLTLTLDNKIIVTAKVYAKKAYQSWLGFGKLIPSNYEYQIKNLPPITKELSGIAKPETTKSDKKLLEEALNNKFF